jgi:hypothetical protein
VTQSLVLEYEGWIVLRLATDPDPTDEPRGISGYSFAFGDEADMDRILYLQPPANFELRSCAPPAGVAVRRALLGDGTVVPAWDGAKVQLLGEPRLENRNWILTPPGFEPIVPFELRIDAGKGLSLQRSAPLDPRAPRKPVWKVDESLLAAQAANGMNYEPDTVGRATGIWDSYQTCVDRLRLLEQEIETVDPGSPRHAILSGRIAELQIARDNREDRRVQNRSYVERFGFPVSGRARIGPGVEAAVGAPVDLARAWTVAFWIGGWDADLLMAYMQGALEVPLGA